MYFKQRESDPRAAAEHNKLQKENAASRLKFEADKRKKRKVSKKELHSKVSDLG